jgi:hypothetical protein
MYMKTYFLFLALSFTPVAFLHAQETPQVHQNQNVGEILVMRVFEPHTIGLGQPMILLAYPNGKTEEILLKKVNKENAAFNAEVLQKTITQLRDQGYVLKTATGGDFYSTYVFEKGA